MGIAIANHKNRCGFSAGIPFASYIALKSLRDDGTEPYNNVEPLETQVGASNSNNNADKNNDNEAWPALVLY